jgi:hypothetical protein
MRPDSQRTLTTMTVSRQFGSATYAFDFDPLTGVVQSAIFYYTQPGCAGTAYVNDDRQGR